jgi:hypothetical protein
VIYEAFENCAQCSSLLFCYVKDEDRQATSIICFKGMAQLRRAIAQTVHSFTAKLFFCPFIVVTSLCRQWGTIWWQAKWLAYTLSIKLNISGRFHDRFRCNFVFQRRYWNWQWKHDFSSHPALHKTRIEIHRFSQKRIIAQIINDNKVQKVWG